MPAAEPAPTSAVVMNTAGGAAVIPLHSHARRQAGRGPRMTQGPEAGAGGSSSSELLAEHVETMFNEMGRSLTDDDTVEVYTLTLTIVQGLFEGAQVKGIVDDDQRSELDAMLRGLLGVPRLVG